MFSGNFYLVNIVKMKHATKDIEKLAETGFGKGAGERDAVNICTRTPKKLRLLLPNSLKIS